jgi:hypothetical protein
MRGDASVPAIEPHTLAADNVQASLTRTNVTPPSMRQGERSRVASDLGDVIVGAAAAAPREEQEPIGRAPRESPQR